MDIDASTSFEEFVFFADASPECNIRAKTKTMTAHRFVLAHNEKSITYGVSRRELIQFGMGLSENLNGSVNN
jgi:hypothetical protein